jgi:hypothetical protein
MNDYTLSGLFEIEATPEAVMERLSSTTGIRTWWSSKVEGSATEVGDEFGVSFPDTPFPFGLTVTAVGPKSVEWLVGEMPPPWAGTTVGFALTDGADGTNLLFTHGGFDPDNPIIPVVTPAWMAIVSGLKAIVEGSDQGPFFEV